MIKTTVIITTFAALGLGAAPAATTANGVPAASLNPVKSLELQIANLDIAAESTGISTQVAETSDFALRLKLKSGDIIQVRF